MPGEGKPLQRHPQGRLRDRLYDAPPSAGPHPFPELAGDTHPAPSTPGDPLFHLRAHRLDYGLPTDAAAIDAVYVGGEDSSYAGGDLRGRG